MINLNPLARIIGLTGIVLAGAAYIGPAFAGPAEVALLKSYEGSWKGKGDVVGTDVETVNCRMSLTDGNDDKVNYSGRCSMAGSALSISGTLAYIEENHRYEGAMTSNVNFSGVAIGQKTGSGIVFNLKERGTQDSSNMEIATSITLSPGVITVNFRATGVNSGKMINAAVPFTKM
jgi:hypothetical protein